MNVARCLVTLALGGVVVATAPSAFAAPVTTGAGGDGPTITATTVSASGESHGWYRSAVTVVFHCTPGSAPLAMSCPGPAYIDNSGAGQSATGSVTDTNGMTATASITGINVDRERPTVAVHGIRPHAVYAAVRRLTCLAHDRYSGVHTCRIETTRVEHPRLITIRFVGVASDWAGNRNNVHSYYSVRRTG